MLANIQAHVLRAPDAPIRWIERTAPGGALLLSGLLTPQAAPLADEYVAAGMILVGIRASTDDVPWSSVALERPVAGGCSSRPARLIAGGRADRSARRRAPHLLVLGCGARVGDAVELVDGAGRRASAVIAHIGAESTVVTASAPEAVVAKPPWLRVLVPPIKGDRMDFCLEKLVEVGADEIVVWPAARAVVRLDPDKREARIAKYQAAAQAAARQSGRAAVPAIRAATSLVDAMAGSSGFVLDPATEAPLALSSPAPAVITIASGPEGGLAPDELDALLRAGFAPAALGPRVLRAEAAPVVAVALIRGLTSS